MRVLALVVASLVVSAASLPAVAACPYKDQVAQSDMQKKPMTGSAAAADQARG